MTTEILTALRAGTPAAVAGVAALAVVVFVLWAVPAWRANVRQRALRAWLLREEVRAHG